MRVVALRAIRLGTLPAFGVALVTRQAGMASMRKGQLARFRRVPDREGQGHCFRPCKGKGRLGVTGHAGGGPSTLVMTGRTIGGGMQR